MPDNFDKIVGLIRDENGELTQFVVENEDHSISHVALPVPEAPEPPAEIPYGAFIDRSSYDPATVFGISQNIVIDMHSEDHAPDDGLGVTWNASTKRFEYTIPGFYAVRWQIQLDADADAEDALYLFGFQSGGLPNWDEWSSTPETLAAVASADGGITVRRTQAEMVAGLDCNGAFAFALSQASIDAGGGKWVMPAFGGRTAAGSNPQTSWSEIRIARAG